MAFIQSLSQKYCRPYRLQAVRKLLPFTARCAHLVTHVVDRNGILRETLVAGQSYEGFERSIKAYLKRRVILLEIKPVPSRREPSSLNYSAK